MKKKKSLQKENIETQFVNKITSLFPDQIVKIFFFGSRAMGIPKPGSDYDFLIVLNEKDRRVIDGIYDVATDFLLRYAVDISLKIYTEKNFQEMSSIPTPFIASILRKGREIWTPKTDP